MRKPRRLGLLAALTAAALAEAAGAQADAISKERQAALRRLVVQDCGSCHGLSLQGGLGKALRPENLSAFSDETMAAVILEGVAGSPMPPWRGLVTEAEARWIAQKLKKGEIR